MQEKIQQLLQFRSKVLSGEELTEEEMQQLRSLEEEVGLLTPSEELLNQQQSVAESLSSIVSFMDDLGQLCVDGVLSEGVLAKQWYLEEIARHLEIELPDHVSGEKPKSNA